MRVYSYIREDYHLNNNLESNRLFYVIPTQSGFVSASCKKESISKSETIVTQLIKSYLHKDHTLYVDNWYTS
ncbi:PiggyBac transposable element-derived protein 4 [Vespula maculifrons]|uniref:PiggyBac transposable element-derived protein 4 n=1 Tax=Vespula maculifrons TaxID=7453 RepID=A0ABD2BVI9_VESMC